MKVQVDFAAHASRNKAIVFADIERSHDAGSPKQVNLYLIDERDEEIFLGAVERNEIMSVAKAIQK